jgi:hypothetical protein
MRHLLTGLAVASLRFVARPAPVAAQETIVCSILGDDVLLNLTLDTAGRTISAWHYNLGSPSILYEGEPIDSVQRKRGKFIFEDKSGVTRTEFSPLKKIPVKGVQLKGFIAISGSTFDIHFKDKTRKQESRLTPNNSDFSCETF